MGDSTGDIAANVGVVFNFFNEVSKPVLFKFVCEINLGDSGLLFVELLEVGFLSSFDALPSCLVKFWNIETACWFLSLDTDEALYFCNSFIIFFSFPRFKVIGLSVSNNQPSNRRGWTSRTSLFAWSISSIVTGLPSINLIVVPIEIRSINL